MLHRLFVVLVPVVAFFLATPHARGQIEWPDANEDGLLSPMDVLATFDPLALPKPEPAAQDDELMARLSFLWGEYLAMNCPSPTIVELFTTICDLLDWADILLLLDDATAAETARRAAEQLLLQLESELTHLALTRIIHQPLGVSPRFPQSSREPDANACRLSCAAFWER